MRCFIRRAVTGAAFALGVIAAANAQSGHPPAAPDPSDLVQSDSSEQIVVTGRRDVEAQIRSFVDALAPAAPRGQLTRFEGPACPSAGGSISEQQVEIVVRRIRAVATAVGIPVGAPGCRPNILVAVVPDKAAYIRAVWRRYRFEAFNSTLSSREIMRLADDPYPAAAWHFSGYMSETGVNLEFVNRAWTRTNRGARGSLATGLARPTAFGGVVVVQDSALIGLTATQLADYAAMRIFAVIDPERLHGSTTQSILRVVDAAPEDEVPVTLTRWDLGFLRGLYHGPGTVFAGEQRVAIRRLISRQLEQAANGN
jgi:hypothetical protein